GVFGDRGGWWLSRRLDARRLRLPGSHLRFAGFQELKKGCLTSVAKPALMAFDYPSVAAGPIHEARRNFREEVLHNGAQVAFVLGIVWVRGAHLRVGGRPKHSNHTPAGMQVALLGDGD